jgi:Domain found in Dishevelled, Egl-10, and Pleckstrin (DEP)/PH domain
VWPLGIPNPAFPITARRHSARIAYTRAGADHFRLAPVVDAPPEEEADFAEEDDVFPEVLDPPPPPFTEPTPAACVFPCAWCCCCCCGKAGRAIAHSAATCPCSVSIAKGRGREKSPLFLSHRRAVVVLPFSVLYFLKTLLFTFCLLFFRSSSLFFTEARENLCCGIGATARLSLACGVAPWPPLLLFFGGAGRKAGTLAKAASSKTMACAMPDATARLERLAERIVRLSGLVGDRRYRLRMYRGVVVGEELTKWLVASGEVSTMEEAEEIGTNLVRGGLLRHVADDHVFKNAFLFYRFELPASVDAGPGEQVHADEDGPRLVEDPPAQTVIDCAAMSGYLLKKGTLLWNRRFVVIDQPHQRMLIYDNETSPKPRCVVRLHTGRVDVGDLGDCKKGNYCFKITDALQGKTHVLCSENSKQQEEWIQALIDSGTQFLEEEFDVGERSIFDFKVRDINDMEIDLGETFGGQVALVVNAASF